MKSLYFNVRHNILLCAVFFSYLSFGQDLERQLTLVRPFEPSVGAAQKITTLPNLQDTFSIRPAFAYSIHSLRIDTRFDVTPIAPVRLQPPAQTRLYNGYVKVGAGSLPNVLTEIAINTLRNREYAAGALFKLDRAWGDVELDKDRKINVFGGYSDVSGKIFGQRFFRNNSILSGELGASGKTVYNYGYNLDEFFDENGEVKLDEDGKSITLRNSAEELQKQYFFADANIGMRSSHFRTDRTNYNLQLDYKLARNKLDDEYTPNYDDENPPGDAHIFQENALTFKAQLDNNMFGGNIKYDFFTRSEAFDTLRNNFALDINPWFTLDNDSVRLKVGMRVAVYREDGSENILQYAIFPSIEFQFTLLKDIFVPFVGIDGYMQPNTYRSIIMENPFITPGLTTQMSKNKLHIYAGLKGNITSKMSYYLRANFINTDNEHFFVNDTTFRRFAREQNHFSIIYDDLTTFNLKTELYFNPIESIELGVKANYYKYMPSKEIKAWHKPEFTLNGFTKFNFRNKLIANLDVMHVGKRYARIYDEMPDDAATPDPDDEVLDGPLPYTPLESFLSFSVGAEYRYTKSFSMFLRLNNLNGARYDRWNFYPSRRFNAMVGFTVSL